MPTIHPFWLAYAAGLVCLHPVFAERDRTLETIPEESIPMDAWLHLSDAARADVVASYAARPPIRL